MVPVNKIASTESARQRARLNFCRRELARRASVEEHEAWRWRIKEKVAGYLIKRLESDSVSSENEPGRFLPLTKYEIQETLLHHPLLQPASPLPRDAHETETAKWSERIRVKVTRYLAQLAHDRQLDDR